ncbi:MFS transporter [Bacillus sp. Au-Bac7]|uniref:MFS transporter n=1 Tax=Bacillus sp. Au-Bac7 TaxID=2906458 RepID=UPI001E5DB644|nr:MFS transporter [Bacillus sp. Au-Bac7]MCE4052109.1 MFS transporter [Bacillus sp. Au-Bac7]
MENSNGRIKNIYIMQVFIIFLGFIIFGFSENIKGPAIPRIQVDFMLNETQIGTLLSLNSLGYLLACTFTAYLTRIWGIKVTTIVAFASMAISGIFIYFSQQYLLFSASYFLMYIGNGMLEIGLAILGARIFIKNTGTMMNLSHGFYGLSSTIAPLIATGLMEVTIGSYTLDWRDMYLIMLLLSAIPIIFMSFTTFSGKEIKHEERIPFKSLLRDPVIWLMILVLTFGVVSELAVGGWLVNFLEKAYGWETISASGMLSAFFLCFALARLLLGPLTDRIGFTISLFIFSGTSALCTFVAVFGGESMAFLFAAAGIGIAMIYPTVMAFIANRYPNNSDTVITITVTFMGLGSVIGNYAIGGVTGWVKSIFGVNSQYGLLRGLQAGYSVIGLCAALCAVTTLILYIYLLKKKEVI